MDRERSERRKKLRKISVLGIKNHRSAAVRGGARRMRPPLDPLVGITEYLLRTNNHKKNYDKIYCKSLRMPEIYEIRHSQNHVDSFLSCILHC